VLLPKNNILPKESLPKSFFKRRVRGFASGGKIKIPPKFEGKLIGCDPLNDDAKQKIRKFMKETGIELDNE
jgi:putative transposon-encoded protein